MNCLCSKCKKEKDIKEFHPQNNASKRRSACIECVLKGLFIKRQLKLKLRFEQGDTKIDHCPCGNYFVNEFSNYRFKEGFALLNRCRTCAFRSGEKRKRPAKGSARYFQTKELLLDPTFSNKIYQTQLLS